MNRKKIFTGIMLTASAAIQFSSLLQYLIGNQEQYIIDWASQYLAVVIVSVGITIVSYVYEYKTVLIVCSLLRFVLIAIVYLPTGIYFGFKQMFINAYLFDLIILVSYPRGVLWAFGSLGAVIAFSFLSMNFTITASWNTTHLLDIVYSVLIIVFTTLFTYYYRAFNGQNDNINNLQATINKLTDANTGFQHYVRVVEEKSTEDERNRIIRELHDAIGYTLTSIIMLSESGLKLAKEEKKSGVYETFHHINNASKTGLTDIRVALRVMKPKKDIRISYQKQLKRLVSAFENATNVRIILEYNTISETMNTDVFHLIFRLVQEGMINSFRHGSASEVRVVFFQEDDKRLNVTVSDNGTGFREMSVGLGLKGIEERVVRLGGEFSVKNTAKGVTLFVTVPLNALN